MKLNMFALGLRSFRVSLKKPLLTARVPKPSSPILKMLEPLQLRQKGALNQEAMGERSRTAGMGARDKDEVTWEVTPEGLDENEAADF